MPSRQLGSLPQDPIADLGDINIRLRMFDLLYRKNQEGYTLLELMFALGISGILLYSIHGILIGQQKAYVLQEQIIDMQQGLRIAMTLMNREIRMAGYDPSGAANAEIVAADENSIQITRDLDGDGNTSGPNEDITYSVYMSGGINKLGRKLGVGNNNPVLEHIESLDFVYRKADGTILTPPLVPSQIGKVEITITARTARADPKYPDNGGYRTRTLTTNISLRN
ncbi:prepilin-type N-terminal cleavage/methylation domain-containing protein [Nitrospira defluvii]|nr:prepilin-type N-terminal cleavage/methylation domain-containing protein [Nitrospira defluvii]